MMLAALSCAGVGLIWSYRAAMAGDVLGAIAAAALCVGVIALDAVAAAVMRLANQVFRCARRIDNLEKRLAASVRAPGAEETAVELENSRASRMSEIVAANVEKDAYPRLVRPTASDVSADQSHNADLSDSDILDSIVSGEMQRLRRDFAAAIRNSDFAKAESIGERIVTLFPDSKLAQEFELIREHLARRATDRLIDEIASAI
jgi:hypothetical protein